MTRAFALVSLLAVSAPACAPADEATQVMVYVDAQPVAASLAQELRVRVWGDDGALRLDETRPLAGITLPLRIPLIPEGGDAGRRFAVEGQLLDAGGSTVSWIRGRGGYQADTLLELVLCFEDTCRGQSCGDTEADCLPTSAGPCSACGGGACVEAAPNAVPAGTGATTCPPADCLATATVETLCGDGIDDDCDGRVDCEDDDCTGLSCGDHGLTCDGAACVCPGGGAEDTVELCHNGVDDDCDGTFDCDEGADCLFEEGPDGCGDGFDNDCDGSIDCMDPSCCIDPACDTRRCGANDGRRCCNGTCVNTWSDNRHCGGCGVRCAAGRECQRVPRSATAGDDRGAACRCNPTANDCPETQVCESHDGANLCNCKMNSIHCPDRSDCRRNGTAYHNWCFYSVD